MPHKKFSIQINNPCSQNWDEMTQQEKGKFCTHCTKVVIDFTVMTENQIIEFFKNHIGEVCGRIHKHQLQHSYALNVGKNPWYAKYFIQFAISGLLTLKIVDSTAQNHTTKAEPISLDANHKNNYSSSEKDEVKKIIEGKVVWNNNESALENTIIKIKETGQSFQTDSTGKFQIELPKDFNEKQFTITFSHIGYTSVSRTISTVQLPVKKLNIRMYNNHIEMGKMMYKPE